MGFIFLFTSGGVTGVMMAVPAIDFEVHNSLFLVAHFHTMIVSGVLFGYFAGLTYWFPKAFGFKLNERLGKYAAYCWIFGFILAFFPLYILGLMGATRRLDHYSTSTGWQPLFIVAGIGAVVIAIGVALQVLQLIFSIMTRSYNRDLTGDPWDGRTLEWSTASPAPFYNFATIPVVHERDAFWAMKHGDAKEVKKPKYQPFQEMKNTGVPIIIAGLALTFGFAFVWHIWWLMFVGLLGIITTMIVRLSTDDVERTVSVAEIERVEAEIAMRGKPA
jgi:cytochrome o ubiquinol oxidase subunit 1